MCNVSLFVCACVCERVFMCNVCACMSVFTCNVCAFVHECVHVLCVCMCLLEREGKETVLSEDESVILSDSSTVKPDCTKPIPWLSAGRQQRKWGLRGKGARGERRRERGHEVCKREKRGPQPSPPIF